MNILNLKTVTLLTGLFTGTLLNAAIDVPQSLLNMKVNSDGIYRISHADVMAMGIDLSGVSDTQIAVYNEGNLVPIMMSSGDDGTFDSSDYIEFVGLTDNSLYQQGSIYSIVMTSNQLVENSSITDDDTLFVPTYYMQTDYYDENTEYSFGAPIDDPWFYKRMLAFGSPLSELESFYLDNLVQTPDAVVSLSMSIWGGTDYLQSPDHHVVYELNGNVIGDFWFDGIVENVQDYEFPTNTFNSGDQQLILTLPGDTNTVADVIHIESWKVNYPRAFVLTEKALDFSASAYQNSNPDILFSNGYDILRNRYQLANATNETYKVYQVLETGAVKGYESVNSGDCTNAVNVNCKVSFTVQSAESQIFVAAESEIKTPELSLPVFLTDINELGTIDLLIISHPDFIGRTLNQFVQSKEAEFSVSVVDVEQIYAQYGNGNVSAQSIAQYIKHAQLNFGVTNVLLVGGDTYDYKDYLGIGTISFIPTMYGATGDLITFAPIDAKYADINDDNIPDINIGRFPVRTDNELGNLTLKIESYVAKNYPLTALFAADKFDVSNGYSFKDDAEFLIAQLPQTWQNNINVDSKAYIDDDGLAASKVKIINNINQGVALTSFIGHSGPRDWSFSRMFSATDALDLVNANNPTLVTQWGCWNTYFVSPQEDTMAHAFMLNQNGGAASVLGASTLTKAEHEKDLAQLVLSYLTENQMTLGDAVTLAKQNYALRNPEALDVILGWNILGDPTLRL